LEWRQSEVGGCKVCTAIEVLPAFPNFPNFHHTTSKLHTSILPNELFRKEQPHSKAHVHLLSSTTTPLHLPDHIFSTTLDKYPPPQLLSYIISPPPQLLSYIISPKNINVSSLPIALPYPISYFLETWRPTTTRLCKGWEQEPTRRDPSRPRLTTQSPTQAAQLLAR
jgi:hypothetical protein